MSTLSIIGLLYLILVYIWGVADVIATALDEEQLFLADIIVLALYLLFAPVSVPYFLFLHKISGA